MSLCLVDVVVINRGGLAEFEDHLQYYVIADLPNPRWHIERVECLSERGSYSDQPYVFVCGSNQRFNFGALGTSLLHAIYQPDDNFMLFHNASFLAPTAVGGCIETELQEWHDENMRAGIVGAEEARSWWGYEGNLPDGPSYITSQSIQRKIAKGADVDRLYLDGVRLAFMGDVTTTIVAVGAE